VFSTHRIAVPIGRRFPVQPDLIVGRIHGPRLFDATCRVWSRERLEYLRFPIWQTFCIQAVKEPDIARLLYRVDLAETAILLRVHQLRDLPGEEEEKRALVDALKSLNSLRQQFARKV